MSVTLLFILAALVHTLGATNQPGGSSVDNLATPTYAAVYSDHSKYVCIPVYAPYIDLNAC